MDTIWGRLAIAVIGAVSLYFGYKLFCDVTQQTRRVSHFVAGGLLAVFGLGLLFTEAHGIAAAAKHPPHGWNERKPAEQGSYAEPRLHRAGWFEHRA